MWEFEVGQLVVCIDDKFQFIDGEKTPTLYNVYTIRSIGFDDVGMFFQLVEIVNKKLQYNKDFFGECGFYAFHFRPVKPTNVDILKDLLVRIPSDADIEHFTSDMTEDEKRDVYAL